MSDATVHEAACRLLKNSKVVARLQELRKPIMDRHNITIDDLIAELDENRMAALTAETVQSSAATAATMAKAKLLGFDKQILVHTGANGGAILIDSAARQSRLAELQAKVQKLKQ
jgi:hypothetical protein